MKLFSHIIKDKLKLKENDRYKSVDNYADYLTFLGFIGKIDSIYIALLVRDRIFIDNNLTELSKHDVFKNLNSLIKKLHENNAYDIKKFFLQSTTNESEIYNSIVAFLDRLDTTTSTHEENFILNYLLNIALTHKLFNTQMSIELVEYFWKTKNCNNYRKDFCIFSIVEYCVASNDRNFFQMKEQFYNHIQKIYSQISRTSILDKAEKRLYQEYLNSILRNNNNLRSKTNNRVAVCISGLYRNHIEALVNIKENIIEPLNADVFIHTWDEKSIWSGNGGSPNMNRLFGISARSIMPEKVSDLKSMENLLPNFYNIIKNPVNEKWDGSEMTNILRPKGFMIESQENFEDFLRHKENYTKSRGSLNQIKMFYGIKKSFDLALESGTYDYIIRIRPDTHAKSKISENTIENLKNNTIYTGVSHVGLFDADFVVSKSVANNLSSFIEKMFEFNVLSPYEGFPLYDSHNLLLAWMIEYGYYFDNPIFHRGLLSMSERKIVIDGLEKAIDSDYANLTENNKAEFLPFIEYIKEHYS